MQAQHQTSATDLAYAEVTLKSGQVVRGRIIRETSDSLFVERDNHEVSPISRDGVDFVTYREHRDANFYEAGLTFGLPGGINLVGGYSFGALGFRVSGGYLGAIYGVELAMPIALSSSDNICHYLAVIGSTTVRRSSVSGDLNTTTETLNTFTGFGAAYQLNYSGFFFELGGLLGSGTLSSPQYTLQIGYVHQFR